MDNHEKAIFTYEMLEKRKRIKRLKEESIRSTSKAANDYKFESASRMMIKKFKRGKN